MARLGRKTFMARTRRPNFKVAEKLGVVRKQVAPPSAGLRRSAERCSTYGSRAATGCSKSRSQAIRHVRAVALTGIAPMDPQANQGWRELVAPAMISLAPLSAEAFLCRLPLALTDERPSSWADRGVRGQPLSGDLNSQLALSILRDSFQCVRCTAPTGLVR